MLRDSLRSPDPTTILVTGTMVAIMAIDPDRHEDPAGAQLIESFLDVDIAEITVVLHLAAALTADDLLRARIHRELAGRRQPVPPMVRDLAAARAVEAWFMTDDLGDGDNIMLGLCWPGGEVATFVVYIDHNLGTIIKDAFVIGDEVENVRARYAELIAESGRGIAPVPMGLGDARDRIEDALTRYVARGYAEEQHQFYPDEEVQTWPQCATLLNHFVESMPPGPGLPERDPKVDTTAIESAFEDFADSPEALLLQTGPSSEAAAGAALTLLSFASFHAGDPLRWSHVTVEICMTQALPANPAVDDEVLDEVPDVLRALIRYAHRVRGIDPVATEETLGAVDRWLVTFEQTRAREDVRALREQVLRELAYPSTTAILTEILENAVGGLDSLASLDSAPLPDEALDLRGVPADLHPVLSEIDEYVDTLVRDRTFAALDVEFRTACRRFLSCAAENDPAVFRRRAKTVNTAAALVWVVGRGNELVGYAPAPVRTGDLMAWLGVSGPPSSRADSLLRAFGAPPAYGPVVPLGSPDVVVGAQRSRLIRRRDTGSWT